MTSKSFLTGRPSALEARLIAQRIAFGPITFEAVRVARDGGVLAAIEKAGAAGLSPEETAEASGMSLYGVRVVCESALSVGVLNLKDERYVLTEVGHVILRDELTRANMDFVKEVCYDATPGLGASIAESRPAGLAALGPWPTVYEGLSQLAPAAKEAWFRFDHLYSDSAFPDALAQVAALAPGRLLDVGGNTGKWSMTVARALPGTHVTMADLPGQLAMAKANVDAAGLEARIGYHPIDLLDAAQELPEAAFDVVWMSQFLCCFSEAEVVRILGKAARALRDGGRILILDTFWDRQRFDVAAFCIINTSPYFTAVANGNSKMYRYTDMERLLGAAELAVESVRDDLGLGHALIAARRAG
jgi:ubiquinone/menaquinone biosynthesis C-methylase UbiE